jgi:NAD(P)H-dependent FMN reductase
MDMTPPQDRVSCDGSMCEGAGPFRRGRAFAKKRLKKPARAYPAPMHRVLLVCGSLQRSSANGAALDTARATLSASGVEVRVFEGLGSIPPLNPDRDDNPGVAVLAFRAEIAAADAVLLAAPEYAGAIAGLVKNALDWIVGSGDLYGKPVALLSAGTSGGVFARKDLVRTLSWQGAHVVASLGIEAANTKSTSHSDGSRTITDPKTLDEIGALASSLLASIAQSPSERFAAMTTLAHDAAVELGPLANHISSQEETWLRKRNMG